LQICVGCFKVASPIKGGPAVAGFEEATRASNAPQLTATKQLAVLDREPVVMRTQ